MNKNNNVVNFRGQNDNIVLKDKQLFNSTSSSIKSTRLFEEHNLNKGEVVMAEFVSRKEFEQFEKRIDSELNNISSKIDKLPDQIEDKIKLHTEKMKNTQMKWFIGVLLTLAGLAGRIFGLY